MHQKLDQLALKTFQSAIEQAPLGVYQSSTRDYRVIPASIEPLVLADSFWKVLQRDASLILRALEKVGSWLRQGAGKSAASKLFANLSPLEQQEAEYGGLATARLDMFFDGEDLKVIEANTTIPAMQAYSDMIKQAYFTASQPSKNVQLQSNSQDLLTSLLQHYERTGGKKPRPAIAIVARPGDSQLAELLWYQDRWRGQGFATQILSPSELTLKDRQIWAQDQAFDLCYRHIFVQRLPRDSAFAQACLHGDTYRVFNPIAAYLEAKGVLAELSRMAADPKASRDLGLSDEEREAVGQRVAWSRLLQSGPALSPDYDKIGDLLKWVKEEQNELVIKSSLGYGGQGVFLGESFGDPAVQARAAQLLGREGFLTWGAFIDQLAAHEDGQWIVQTKISGRKLRHKFLHNGRWSEGDTYIDCSIFCSSGIPFQASGGACRFSSDTIVNIGQGGGLMPLLLASEIS